MRKPVKFPRSSSRWLPPSRQIDMSAVARCPVQFGHGFERNGKDFCDVCEGQTGRKTAEAKG